MRKGARGPVHPLECVTCSSSMAAWLPKLTKRGPLPAVYKSSLQRRIARIESALDVPAEERRTFNVLLAKATPRTMEGERIDLPTIGRKSVWRASDGEEVSVEGLCLEQYQREGWKG